MYVVQVLLAFYSRPYLYRCISNLHSLNIGYRPSPSAVTAVTAGGDSGDFIIGACNLEVLNRGKTPFSVTD